MAQPAVSRVLDLVRSRLRPMAGVGERRSIEEALWPNALAAGRAASTASALLLFIASITLDDLHLFRVPIIYVGAASAALVFAFGPPVLAFRLLHRIAVDAPDRQTHAVEAVLIRRRAGFGASIAVFLAWLVYFSAGRTVVW